MKKMMILQSALISITLVLTLSGLAYSAQKTATPAALDPKSVQVVEELRQKLTPVITSTLQEQCGEECPSFKIDPILKGGVTDVIEDLGFSKSVQIAPTPELKGVSLSVLVQDSVAQSNRDSLRQILIYRLSNEVSVPVTVQLKALAAVPPIFGKRNQPEKAAAQPHWSTWLKDYTWPAATLLLAMMAFTGLVLVLGHRKKMFEAARKPLEEAKAEPIELAFQPMSEQVKGELELVLENRQRDLEWLIEERAAAKDKESLARIISLFSPERLSSKIQLSGQALHGVASLPVTSAAQSQAEAAPEALNWLKRALDRAHWRRKEEERNPLAALSRYSDIQLADLFESLSEGTGRGALFSVLPKGKWPQLLSRLSGDERIQLGLEMSAFEAASAIERVSAQVAIVKSMEKSGGGATVFAKESGLVEEFTLFLNEREGKSLWQKLATHHSRPAPAQLTAEGVFESLNKNELMEICMRLDLQNLKLLLNNVSAPVRDRVTTVLPKSLQERLAQGSRQSKARSAHELESSLMLARADLMGAYRKFQDEGQDMGRPQ